MSTNGGRLPPPSPVQSRMRTKRSLAGAGLRSTLADEGPRGGGAATRRPVTSDRLPRLFNETASGHSVDRMTPGKAVTLRGSCLYLAEVTQRREALRVCYKRSQGRRY